jgi:Xaa-Pro aminopeptidase
MNYILKNENAIYYECGYSCDNALYIKLGAEAFFITDSRYKIEAQQAVVGAEVIIERDLYKEANKILKKSKIKKLSYDSKEWSLFAFGKLTDKLKIKFKPKPDFSHQKRIIKSFEEIETLTIASQLGVEAFDFFAEMIVSDGFGRDEYSLTYMAKTALSGYGKYELSFDPIVAINANASKPHAMPTADILQKKELLLVDAGLKYKRYCSDRTRTIYANKNLSFDTEQKFKSKKIQKVYDTVLKAHDNAIEKARTGMKAEEIDALTRDIIDRAGFGKYFVHSTGHGVGLDIHEMPYITSRSDTIIEDGMVYTIEPGIYIPDEFGIRIEDMVAMIDGRAVVL